jgi:hypothetical protein
MAHHELYGRPEEFLSDVYRSPPASRNSVLYFAAFLGGLAVLLVAVLPWQVAMLLVIEGLLLAWANSYLHDGLHVRGFWLERFRWFGGLRRLHRQHHRDMTTNFGIYAWLWDRAFRTFDASAADLVGPHGRVPTHGMRREFLVAVSVVPGLAEADRIELRAVLAEDAARAMAACADPAHGICASHAVPLEGDVLALWNELGKAAFGFGR